MKGWGVPKPVATVHRHCALLHVLKGVVLDPLGHVGEGSILEIVIVRVGVVVANDSSGLPAAVILLSPPISIINKTK